MYYDINVQIYADNGEIYYSVIQEHEEDGSDMETLGSGVAVDLADARKTCAQLVSEALSRD